MYFSFKVRLNKKICVTDNNYLSKKWQMQAGTFEPLPVAMVHSLEGGVTMKAQDGWPSKMEKDKEKEAKTKTRAMTQDKWLDD